MLLMLECKAQTVTVRDSHNAALNNAITTDAMSPVFAVTFVKSKGPGFESIQIDRLPARRLYCRTNESTPLNAVDSLRSLPHPCHRRRGGRSC